MKIRWSWVMHTALGVIGIMLSGGLTSFFVWLCFQAMNWWTATNVGAGVVVYEIIAGLAIGIGIAGVIAGIAILWLAPAGVGVGLAISGALLLLLNRWFEVGYMWHDWYWWLIWAAGIIVMTLEVIGALYGWYSWPSRLRSLEEVYATGFMALLWSGGSVLAVCILLGFFPSLCVAISPFFI